MKEGFLVVISCPECATKFRLEDTRVSEGGAKVRCSRCKHIFEVKKQAEPVPMPPEEIFPSQDGPPAAAERQVQKPRKRGRRLLHTVIGIGLIVVAGVIGLELFKEEFTQSILPIVRQYIGLGEAPEGFVSVENERVYFLENIHLGNIFVIEGQAVNHWNEPRSFIKVKGSLLDSKGKPVGEKTAYCGNILSEKDLKEMSGEEIEKSLSSQFGESFANVNIPPRKSTPFMIVFTDFSRLGSVQSPKPSDKVGGSLPGVSNYTVEVISSQKGSAGKG